MKLTGNLSKGKNQVGSAEAMHEDMSLTISEMEEQFYQGYPAWRKDGYAEQKTRVKNIFGTEEKYNEYRALELVSVHALSFLTFYEFQYRLSAHSS